jgi:hypothetical protein
VKEKYKLLQLRGKVAYARQAKLHPRGHHAESGAAASWRGGRLMT